ncbi:helix-turn-helix domain-containing protein [Dyella solisilvae]|uniref:citrate synthase (unknown stereospecificity) n=1 Tax=Dyella solisilvae TaxID=1920168 RepID=A0A370K5Z9_9GAMM|nr:citrate synthase family protein [Dyella solisilvae]RDI98075.1 helix-turn-helix domain-containing protein [Dyella solisilvae]
MRAHYLNAREAATLLGVSPATLYAYVSRGKIDSRPGPDGRSREYLAGDIERLIERRRAGRGAAHGAAQSLTWGLPVLETRISLIRPGGHYYRGESALTLARSGASLEDVATLLWDGQGDPFAAAPPGNWPEPVGQLLRQRSLPPLERTAAALPLLSLYTPYTHSTDTAQRREYAAQLLRQTAALLCATRPDRRPIHRLIADSWKRGDEAFAALVRSTLVLCADHELNASAFATRVAASTGASLHAAVGAGLAALSGPQHGGAAARAHAFIQEALRERRPVDHVRERLRRGDELPAFGHPLYPEGDPRAALLLTMIDEIRPRPAGLTRIRHLVDAVKDCSGREPSLDFALATIAWLYDLGADAALSLFAAGRMAGWLAHALEQQDVGGLIRPRANYAGTLPGREG